MQLSGQQLIDAMPLSVIVTDLAGTITDVNGTLLDYLQRNADDITNRPLSDITLEENHAADQDALEALAQGQHPAPYIKELVASNGTALPVEVYPGAIRDDSGQITHALFTMKNLSEEMQLLQQLQRRNMQLVASSEVSVAATQILDSQELLTRCVDLIRTHFGFYYAAIFLIDEANEWAVLRAATGEAGQKLLEQEHKLGVGSQSMVGWVTANSTARIALDVGEEAIRFDNPLLPKTRSEMALPLRVRGEVIGALDSQSTVVNAFTTEDIQTIQMMADQVAIAIDNARLFSQLQGTDVTV
jgi:PAS domain S-box-containing protein